MNKYLIKYCSSLFLLMLVAISSLAQKQKKQDSDLLIKQIKTELDVTRNYSRALDLSKQGVKKFPNDVDIRFLLARSLYLSNDLTRAHSVLDEIIEKAPNYKDAYITIANVQMAQKKSNDAIRYLNKGLARFHQDKELRIKKMSIYQSFRNYDEAGRQADTLLRYHRNDAASVKMFIDYHTEVGQYYQKLGNSLLAVRSYNRILEIDPKNVEARRGIMNAQMQTGDAENSLIIINQALIDQPNSYEFLMKKVGVLQEMKRYPEAIETLQKIIKDHAGDPKARQLDVELKLEAGRYYKSTDPYFQYQSVLERSPGNREALDNVISIAISRGMYDDALYWINRVLKGGNDRNLLLKKMNILQKLGKYGQAADIAEQIYKSAPNADNRETYIDLRSIVARDLAGQQQYDSALVAYGKILAIDKQNEQALNASVNILSGQKNYVEALALVDVAIDRFPGERSWIMKKAAILQEDEQYDEAATLLSSLLKEGATDVKLNNAIAENLMMGGRQMMQNMDHDGAALVFERVLDLQPDNKEALNSLINIELARGGNGYQAALDYSTSGLERFANDRELLLKRSEALFRLKRYQEAYAITDSLRKKYPYNPKIRESYKDQLMIAATAAVKSGDTLGAIGLYTKALEVAPADTLALTGIINAYMGLKEYDSALAYAHKGMELHEAYAPFLIKRAAALESQSKFREAALAADSIVRLMPESRRYIDYAAYLHSKTFKNQLGLSYLNASIDSAQSANIATLQYTRFAKKYTLTTRLNFAGRSFGTGLQGELESYINHSPKWYSFVNLAAANSLVFPRYKAAYSLFHNFNKGWEAELGGRWLNFDTLSAFSGVGSVSKYLADFWLNLRGYVIFVGDKQYAAANLTARQYLNNKTDFFFTVLGYGNSPDDFSRAFQLGTIVTYRTYSIGAGYQRSFNYRNIVSLNGTWFNQRIAETRYRNQYDIYLTFFRKF